MRILLVIITLIMSLGAAKVVKIDEKYQTSNKCQACHMPIVEEWEKSQHSKSHYENDEYFRASIDYISKKTRKSLSSVKIECATCHNPRISVTSTSESYEIMVALNLDKGSAINKAVNSDSINEGINCVVCHNIDKIHTDRDESVRGMNRVTWMKSGIMAGPYKDANSPYHKTQYRDFMNENSDKLCFVCHANDKSVKGLVFTNMLSEYQKGKKSCVDCHMGPRIEGAASTLPIDNGKVKKREVREHGFKGAHVFSMWKDALDINLVQKKNNIIIEISNPQPHNIPSGFGARELIIDVTYKNGAKDIKNKRISLTTHYTRRGGKPTIPHAAEKASEDMSIPANGKKVFKLPNVKGAKSIKVELYYRLVNDEVRSILKLKEKVWAKESLITTKEIRLK